MGSTTTSDRVYRSIKTLRLPARCVFCGSAADREWEGEACIPMCESCNTHGPFGAGWPAYHIGDLAAVAPSKRAAVDLFLRDRRAN
jgi:hypothetical protein